MTTQLSLTGGSSRGQKSSRHLARGVRSAQLSIHPHTGWLRVEVDRTDEGTVETFGVVGYSADHEPVTSHTLLGPKEQIGYVEILADAPVAYVKVSAPSLTERGLARTAIHTLRSLYGYPYDCMPNVDCGCELPLGAAWRWFEACEVEAALYSAWGA